jgi:hypothetical protein
LLSLDKVNSDKDEKYSKETTGKEVEESEEVSESWHELNSFNFFTLVIRLQIQSTIN